MSMKSTDVIFVVISRKDQVADHVEEGGFPGERERISGR